MATRKTKSPQTSRPRVINTDDFLARWGNISKTNTQSRNFDNWKEAYRYAKESLKAKRKAEENSIKQSVESALGKMHPNAVGTKVTAQQKPLKTKVTKSEHNKTYRDIRSAFGMSAG